MGSLNSPCFSPLEPQARTLFPFGSNFTIRDIKVPRLVKRHPNGFVKFPLFLSLGAPSPDLVSLRIKFHDPVFSRVGHVNKSIGVDDNTTRREKPVIGRENLLVLSLW